MTIVCRQFYNKDSKFKQWSKNCTFKAQESNWRDAALADSRLIHAIYRNFIDHGIVMVGSGRRPFLLEGLKWDLISGIELADPTSPNLISTLSILIRSDVSVGGE